MNKNADESPRRCCVAIHRRGEAEEATAPPGSRRAMIIQINRMMEVLCCEVLVKRRANCEFVPPSVVNLSYLEHQRALRFIEDVEGFEPVTLFPYVLQFFLPEPVQSFDISADSKRLIQLIRKERGLPEKDEKEVRNNFYCRGDFCFKSRVE